MCSTQLINDTLQQFWGLEHIGISENKFENLTQDEFEAVQLMDKESFYSETEKTWYTSLLFKEEPRNLENNFVRAKAVLSKVEKSAIKDGCIDALNEAYNDLLIGGFSEKVPDNEVYKPDGSVHYLQCHPVYKMDRDSTKVRIVMNASAKRGNKNSLNELLFQGPCLLPDLVQCWVRFMANAVAFVLDISKMFLRIKLVKGKDFLRFLWRNCDESIPPEIWRMIVVTFGVISSPFQAIYIVRKHSDLFQHLYNLARKSIHDNMYMDDIPDGDKNHHEAKELVTQIYELLLKASMTPHKFASNDPSILDSIPSELRNPKTTIKVLGVQWDTIEDKLLFNFVEKFEQSNKDTKLTFLQQSAKIFDPLGLISPLTTTVKILFQQIWLNKLDWDDPLPPSTQQEWTSWQDEIKKIKDLKKDRYFFDKSKGMPKRVELLAFGDASIKAYATAVYVKGIYTDNSSTCTLVFSKTRVTPIKMTGLVQKPETIVRLELLAALITARAVDYISCGLSKKLNVDAIHCFTDSMINLHRIRNGPDKYKIWVGHRIKEILSLTKKENWRHCPGALNPADLPSRGMTADELIQSDLWWKGPEFATKTEEFWPQDSTLEQSQMDSELKKSKPFAFNTQKVSQEFSTVFNRFSSWTKTVNLFAVILRLGCPAHKQFQRKPQSLKEKNMTEMFLFRISQKKGFVKEFSAFQKSEEINLKNSQLKDYNPRWDCKKRLIISESRLTQSDLPEDTKRPIILPKNCEIVDKFVQYLHEIEGHSGPEHILSVVRQKFRLIQGRRQIRRILHKCLKRGCVKPTPLTQQMAPLPPERTNDQAAFRHTAVDLFGPLFAKHWCQFDKCPHPPQTKVYGALFTCFHSRAVHLELIRDQGTEEFMAAFRSFVGRRGTPNTMYSDNAKNFKSACKEIRSLYRSINWSKVKETGLINKIDWQFSTERAPWTNAICERMVRSVKAPLRIILGSANLTYRQLSVILTEVEGIVNNRPLSLVTDHPDDLIPITPAELIIGRKMNQLPDPNIQHNETNIVHLWRKRQATLNSFWKRWRNDYLLAQDVRKKWRTPSHENLVNKLVLIRDDNMARNEWKFGKITDTVKSKDGLIRTVVVKTPTSILRRPIQRISLFENI